jgi:hypothetical protein
VVLSLGVCLSEGLGVKPFLITNRESSIPEGLRSGPSYAVAQLTSLFLVFSLALLLQTTAKEGAVTDIPKDDMS